jgi:hypothetical protein
MLGGLKMKNNDLNPQLEKLLKSLSEVPERDIQSRYAGREDYLAKVKTLKPHSLPRSVKSSRRSGRQVLVTRFVTIAAVLLVLLSGLGGTAYAAQGSQPDDLLYGVKILTEEIQVNLESDPEDSLDLYVSFANRRLQEIQSQLQAGEQVSEKALELLEKHTQKMLEQAAKMDVKGLNNALYQIEENLQKQNQMMAELGKEHPQGGPPGLLKAQEKIQERQELIENGKNDPQGFQEKYRQQNEMDGDEPGTGEGNSSGNSENSPGNGSDNGNKNGSGGN